MVVIGITGPTGAGKTTALRELEKLGGCVLDADAIYHELLASDSSLQNALRERFGPMEDAQGRFDRKRLGAVVFRDARAMADLNAITYPYLERAIRARLAEGERAGRAAAAIDAIRLLESGAAEMCDVTVAITAPPEVRVARIMAREGISEAYARARVAAQQPDCFYTEGCRYTLCNDGPSPEEFGARARALFASILGQDT